MELTSGLPFDRVFTMEIPSDRTWWLNGFGFEVLMQIREGPSTDTPLIADLAQYIVTTYIEHDPPEPFFDPGPDYISMALTLTGADTRTITESGYYDIIVSDTLTTDERAYNILSGYINRLSLVTASAEGVL
jgi:hypothetical protein